MKEDTRITSGTGALKALTCVTQHVKPWKKISKSCAHSTVQECNQLRSYGQTNGGFVMEGELPAMQDSKYRHQASFIKFLGTTRKITHPMTLVRSAVGDLVGRENTNGILWLLKQLEHGLFRAIRSWSPWAPRACSSTASTR